MFHLSRLLHAERLRRGTRKKRRALTRFRQAVLVLRWLLDGTRMTQLARDNTISKSTGYTYLHEAIAVLAAQAPALHSALTRGESRRLRPRPPRRHPDRDRPDIDPRAHPRRRPVVVEKHRNHGGNIQILTAPDGWPLWTSPVRPVREHDTTCLRTHPGLLDTLAAVRDDLRTLADLGYDSWELLRDIAATKAHYLCRTGARRTPLILTELSDDSYLSVLGYGRLKVRIIEAWVTITGIPPGNW